MLLTVLVTTALFGDPELDATLARSPPTVRAFVGRVTSCNHWRGEYGYDAERRREIERALRMGHCQTINADIERFRTRFRGNASILKLLDAAENPS